MCLLWASLAAAAIALCTSPRIALGPTARLMAGSQRQTARCSKPAPAAPVWRLSPSTLLGGGLLLPALMQVRLRTAVARLASSRS